MHIFLYFELLEEDNIDTEKSVIYSRNTEDIKFFSIQKNTLGSFLTSFVRARIIVALIISREYIVVRVRQGFSFFASPPEPDN